SYDDNTPTSYSIDFTATSQAAVDSPNKAYNALVKFPSDYVITAIPSNCASVSASTVSCTSSGANQLMAAFSSVIAADVSNPEFDSVQVNGETCSVSGSCAAPSEPATTSSASGVPSEVMPTPGAVPTRASGSSPFVDTSADRHLHEKEEERQSTRIVILAVTLPVLALMAIIGYCLWRRNRPMSSSAVGVLHHNHQKGDSAYSVGSDPFVSAREKSEQVNDYSYHAYANEKDYPYGSSNVATYRQAAMDAGTGTRPAPPQYEARGLGMTLIDIPPPSCDSDLSSEDDSANINYFQGEDDTVERSSEFVSNMHPARPAAALTTSGMAEISVDGDLNDMDGNNNVQRSKSIRYPFSGNSHQGSNNHNNNNNKNGAVTVTANLQRSVSCASSFDSTKSQRLRSQLQNFQGPLHLQSERVQEEQGALFKRQAGCPTDARQKVPSPYGSPSQNLLKPLQQASVTRSMSMMNQSNSRGINHNFHRHSRSLSGRAIMISEPIALRPPKSVHRKPSRETMQGLSRSRSTASTASSNSSTGARDSMALVEEEIIRSFSQSAAQIPVSSATRSLLRPGQDDVATLEMGTEESVVVRPRQPKTSAKTEDDNTSEYRRSGGIYGYL
ncbi:hypothetical protein BG004_003063, partial [Podila humilis]